MAYSHLRLRKTLAMVRMATGLLLTLSAWHKLFSPEYAAVEWPRSVDAFLSGQAVRFYPHGALDLVWRHMSAFASANGMIELALGAALFLGIAVRPAAMLGMIYYFNFVLVSWRQAESFSECLSLQSPTLFLILLLLLLCLGHAGETWGAGSLYHQARAQQWRTPKPAQPDLVDDILLLPAQPDDFEESWENTSLENRS